MYMYTQFSQPKLCCHAEYCLSLLNLVKENWHTIFAASIGWNNVPRIFKQQVTVFLFFFLFFCFRNHIHTYLLRKAYPTTPLPRDLIPCLDAIWLSPIFTYYINFYFLDISASKLSQSFI